MCPESAFIPTEGSPTTWDSSTGGSNGLALEHAHHHPTHAGWHVPNIQEESFADLLSHTVHPGHPRTQAIGVLGWAAR